MRQTLAAVLGLMIWAAPGFPQQAKKNAALEGVDPVLLTEGQEVSGKDSLTLEHGRFLYQFSSEETRERFRKDPDRYSIQNDGACARMGPPVNGSPDAYYVYEHRIYIFGSQECYQHFKENPARYLESAQPQGAWNPTEAERKRGQALLKKTLDAMGGAAKWQSVESFVETRKIAQGQNQATMIITVRTPDILRSETVTPTASFGSLVTPDGALNIFRGEGARLPRSFTAAAAVQLRRNLLPFLVEASRPGADVYSTAGDRLTVRSHGIIATLLLDPASGRVSGLTSHGRTQDGFADYRFTYTDYREAGGLQLPFHAESVIDGHPESLRGWTVESYQFNPPDIEARLQPPAKIREN